MLQPRSFFACSLLTSAMLCNGMSSVNETSSVYTPADIKYKTSCYSFFGEFDKSGAFVLIENATPIACNPRVRHCFVEFYRLSTETWFNGQCDDSFACIHESAYSFSNGCQATFHGGDRCCCSGKLCNFNLILRERPYFAKYLPQNDMKSSDIPLGKQCGKVKSKSN